MVLDGSGKPFGMVFYVLLKCLQFWRQNFKVTTYFRSPDLTYIVPGGLRPRHGVLKLPKMSHFGGKFKFKILRILEP